MSYYRKVGYCRLCGTAFKRITSDMIFCRSCMVKTYTRKRKDPELLSYDIVLEKKENDCVEEKNIKIMAMNDTDALIKAWSKFREDAPDTDLTLWRVKKLYKNLIIYKNKK